MVVSLLKKIYNHSEEFVCVTLYGFILLILSYQIVLRYAFSQSNSWSEEIARYSFVWIVYLASSYAVKENRHLKIDAFMGIWPKKIRPYIPILGNTIWLIFCIVITIMSTRYVINIYGMNKLSMGLGINMAVAYSILPIGNFLITIRLIFSIIDYIKDLKSGRKDQLPWDTEIKSVIE